MNLGGSGTTNDLDHIRRFKGINACKNMFGKLGKERRENAVQLVNDSRLSFTSLFILQPEIKKLNLREDLSKRNQTAINICERISDEQDLSIASDYSIPLKSEEVHSVLLWVFNTGVADDGLNDEFDLILDVVASVLIKTHHEKTILPLMTEVIFKRNQKGRFIHDLVWACFQTRDPNALRLIAGYLRSSVTKDVDLAHILLHLPQDVPLRTSYDKQKQYVAYLSWLKENDPYINFTGENFQSTNNPIPCVVDLEAKYLCRDSSIYAFKQIPDFTGSERIYLVNFNALSENEKSILARHSQKLHSENPSYWNEWMQYPVDKQIQTAQYGGGNQHGCHC